MRDHPGHQTPMLGGCFDARLDQPPSNIRQMWKDGWRQILGDSLAYADRSRKQPDQMILARHIWPWGKNITMQHDSYL